MWDKPRDLFGVASGLTMVGLALGLAALAVWLARQPAFALRTITIQGSLQESDPSYLARIAQKGLTGTYFTLDLQSARQAFEQDPWVEQARIRRVWPRALEVHIEERTPVALWNDGKLLSNRGVLFQAITERPLPEVRAPDALAGDVLKRLTQWQRALNGLRLDIERITVSERRAWEIRLSNGVVAQLGREQVDERFVRFVQSLRRIEGGGAQAQFDMRYRDGFSVRMRAEKRGEGA